MVQFYSSRMLFFHLAGLPLENVVDPTGAGDSFAGAMMGYLTSKKKTDLATIKESVLFMGTLWVHLLFKDTDLKDYYESKNWTLKKECALYKKITRF